MSVRIIPLENAKNEGNFTVAIDMDGEDFQLHFQLNDREDFWYFDLLDVDGNQLRSGIKAVSNFPLLRLMVHNSTPARPAGEIMCIDTLDNPTDSGVEDFGISAEMAYIQEVSLP